jgi:hypothetical protein
LEIVSTVFAMPRCRPWGSGALRLVLIRPIEGQRGSSLRQPRRRKGIDLQRLECDGAKHRVALGNQQGIEEVPSTVSMERGPG